MDDKPTDEELDGFIEGYLSDGMGGIFSTGLTTITFEVKVWDT